MQMKKEEKRLVGDLRTGFVARVSSPAGYTLALGLLRVTPATVRTHLTRVLTSHAEITAWTTCTRQVPTRPTAY